MARDDRDPPDVPLPTGWYWHIEAEGTHGDLKIFAKSKGDNTRCVAQRYQDGRWIASYMHSRQEMLRTCRSWSDGVPCKDKDEAVALAASYTWLNVGE